MAEQDCGKFGDPQGTFGSDGPDSTFGDCVAVCPDGQPWGGNQTWSSQTWEGCGIGGGGDCAPWRGAQLWRGAQTWEGCLVSVSVGRTTLGVTPRVTAAKSRAVPVRTLIGVSARVHAEKAPPHLFPSVRAPVGVSARSAKTRRAMPAVRTELGLSARVAAAQGERHTSSIRAVLGVTTRVDAPHEEHTSNGANVTLGLSGQASAAAAARSHLGLSARLPVLRDVHPAVRASLAVTSRVAAEQRDRIQPVRASIGLQTQVDAEHHDLEQHISSARVSVGATGRVAAEPGPPQLQSSAHAHLGVVPWLTERPTKSLPHTTTVLAPLGLSARAAATVSFGAPPSHPRLGPCEDWADLADVFACGSCSALSVDTDLLLQNLTIATEILYRMTGMQFTGGCVETIRPCCLTDACSIGNDTWQSWGYPYIPELVAGRWYNAGPAGKCQVYDCGQTFGQIDLGFYPVSQITLIKIDGVALHPAAYRLDQWRYLTRVDGEQWPTAQNLAKSDTQPGTWSVQFTHGQQVPETLRRAASELACELTKQCIGDQKCLLPLRVTSVSRQGVSYSVADVMDVLDRGATGLYFTDLALKVYNPNKLDRPPRVVSLDRRGPRRLGSSS